jgi:hypothetical protein
VTHKVHYIRPACSASSSVMNFNLSSVMFSALSKSFPQQRQRMRICPLFQ